MATFSNRLRQLILLIIVFSLGLLLLRELYLFFPGFLGAMTLYILSRGTYRRLVEVKKWSRSWTAALFLLLFFVLFGVPTYWIVQLISPKINEVFSHSQEMIIGLRSVSAQIKEWTGQELLTEQNLNTLQVKITGFIPSFLNTTALMISNIAMLLFLYFFMLTGGNQLENAVISFLPLKDENIDILAKETMTMVRANAIGIPLISLIQGVFSLLGYWMFGVNEFVLWGFLTGVFAFFPIVGTTIIWLPIVVYLFSQGQTVNGIWLTVWSLLITGNVDYLARITLMKKLGDVHPVITVLGVIVGLSLFGFWGFIFGPLLISYFLLLFKIYASEFGPLHQSSQVHHHDHS
jgi:predicted PurR-regulated permease PerM